jgi:hypothetical protein
MPDEVTFLCSFPPIQSAIKIDGQGGARIQLDIPENEMGNFIAAMQWRGEVLEATVKPCKTGQIQGANGEKFNNLDKRTNRKSAWSA